MPIANADIVVLLEWQGLSNITQLYGALQTAAMPFQILSPLLPG
jgi:hypothetical protein